MIYDSSMHPLSNLNPSKCGNGMTPRDKHIWAVNTLKLMEQLQAIIVPSDAATNKDDMDTREGHYPPAKQHGLANVGGSIMQQAARNNGKAPLSSAAPEARHNK